VPPSQKGKAPRPPQQTASVARRRGPRRSPSNPDGAQKGTAEGALGARTVANHFAPAVGCPIKPSQSEKRRALHSKKKKRACPVAPDSAPSNHPSAVQWATKMNQRHRVGRQTWADGRGRGLSSRRPRQFGATRPRCEATLLWGDTPSPRNPAPQPPRATRRTCAGASPTHTPPRRGRSSPPGPKCALNTCDKRRCHDPTAAEAAGVRRVPPCRADSPHRRRVGTRPTDTVGQPPACTPTFVGARGTRVHSADARSAARVARPARQPRGG